MTQREGNKRIKLVQDGSDYYLTTEVCLHDIWRKQSFEVFHCTKDLGKSICEFFGETNE